MKYKKITILIILTILLFICSLSTISAANQTINDTSTGGISQGITDTDPNDTLFLNPGIYNKTQDRNIIITKNITIQGNGSKDSVIIDAQGLSRIFTINNNLNVTFINIKFTNGYSGSANGGAIYNANRVTMMTVINCTFTNNQAHNNQGGAVYSTGNNSVFNGCTFINNTANNRGGAILNNGGSYVNITNCNFTNNIAIFGYGGAVHSAGSTFNLTVSGCNFTNNTSGGGDNGGGGICIVTHNATVIGCNFINNTVLNGSSGTGGGLSTGSGFGNLTVIDCNFTGNTAATSGGGATFAANATVIGCNFINNSADTYGGGIRSTAGHTLFVIDSNFTGNNAGSYAGGISNSGSDALSNLTAIRCNFINNSANRGGGIYNAASSSIVLGSVFINNSANRGGGIYNAASSSIVLGSVFINNSANRGGGFYQSCTGSDVVVNGSIFVDNSATEYGGAIFNNVNISVSNNTMSCNSAGLGQMIYNNGTMGVLNLTFINNSTVIVKNGSTVILNATLVDDMGNTVTGQNISFYLNGVLYENIESIEGKASINYTVPSSSGDIPVSGVYAGNGAYDILIYNDLLQVRIPTKITISLLKEVKVGDKITLESKLTDEDGNPIAGAIVDFYIDGVKVGSGITDADGIAKLNYTFTKAGKPNVVAKFAGDNTYMASNATNSTTVSKIPTTITVKTDKDTIIATLTDEDGNPLANKKVTITINGKTYTKTTDSKGQVIIKYKNAWDYKVTAKFAGDEKYLASKATAPKRTPTKITIKTEGDKITATLTDKNGKPIAGKKLTFRVKCVIIGVGITDANGQVVIYYKNANKRSVTVSFEGDSEYAPSSATSTPISENVQASGKVAMKNTDIPIIAVLLVLLASICLVTVRKRK